MGVTTFSILLTAKRAPSGRFINLVKSLPRCTCKFSLPVSGVKRNPATGAERQLLPHPLFCQCGEWRKTVEVNLESLRQVNRVANFTAGFF